jgi:hypothetical protein
MQEQRKIPLSFLQIRVYVYNIYSNLEINDMINKQLQPTCGHKTFGFQWLFEHPSTLQRMVSGDKNAARSPKRFMPQNRCATWSPPITNINA